ncbi:MAG: STAS domain-containing protein [Enhygromyxa sp.]
MPVDSLVRARAQVVEAVAARICRRAATAFEIAGEEACRGYVGAGFDALLEDLASGKTSGTRAVANQLIDELAGQSLGFSDLRAYTLGLRKAVREVLASEPAADELRLRVEEWFFELLLGCTTRFMAWRDQALLQESAKQSVERLESQLAELALALDEKTQLLDVIRQASTPIVPVVSGILVVPLVGTLDAFRAELLAEKLLHEITRNKARTAILDISGVPVFDTLAAQLMIRLARSVRLLGARVFLVGMSPDIAMTVVGLGIELSSVESYATLQDGLARALVSQNMEIVRH